MRPRPHRGAGAAVPNLRRARPMPHVVLLGDSVFDNAAYVRGGPAVADHLAALLPAGWRVTLGAVDGAVIDDVHRQLARLPALAPDATHLVLSAGGNDALGHADLLDRPTRSSAETLDDLAAAADAFVERYRRLLAAFDATGLPSVACTIYNGNLGPPAARRAAAALAVFNDAVQRLAAEHRTPVSELRNVCTSPADYANPIEPSVIGGGKIARAIMSAIGGST